MEEVLPSNFIVDERVFKREEVFCSRCGNEATNTWGFRVEGYEGQPALYLCQRCCYDMLAVAIKASKQDVKEGTNGG